MHLEEEGEVGGSMEQCELPNIEVRFQMGIPINSSFRF